MKGDGTLLGGVYVIGPNDQVKMNIKASLTFVLQGIVFEHREEVWGDHCNSTILLEAVKKLSKHQ